MSLSDDITVVLLDYVVLNNITTSYCQSVQGFRERNFDMYIERIKANKQYVKYKLVCKKWNLMLGYNENLIKVKRICDNMHISDFMRVRNLIKKQESEKLLQIQNLSSNIIVNITGCVKITYLCLSYEFIIKISCEKYTDNILLKLKYKYNETTESALICKPRSSIKNLHFNLSVIENIMEKYADLNDIEDLDEEEFAIVEEIIEKAYKLIHVSTPF